MIYITGDTHGTYDVNKIFKLKNALTEDDYLIVLGDFGVCWDNNGEDNKVRNFWNRHKCKVLFIDGNHENFDLLNAYHVSEWHGGKVHSLGKKITHLMRGQVFEIEGKTFFTMGGAASHDCGRGLDDFITDNLDQYHTLDWNAVSKNWNRHLNRDCRIPGRSWWAAEVPNPDEIAEAKANLAAVGNRVDFVLTHTVSSRIYRHLGFSPTEKPWNTGLIEFFDWIEDNVEFEHWWFGHLHQDFVYDKRHTGFYDAIKTV
ncbi:MAG: metallophosphoesterase [Oscillospiraceae bacterium]|jgi:predicted phosphodiesterase|nr:metallophosphoesterase [Oscillospiraceae bacterium]